MKAIIIGAGIGGLTTAIALQQKGIEVEIYEAAPLFGAVGAGIWLGGNAMNVYERLGLAAIIKANSIYLEQVYIKDVNNHILQLVDNDKIKARFGNATQAIHRATLHDILANAFKGPLHLGKRCCKIDDTTVFFEDGTNASADVIIGADGIRSVIREKYITNATYRYSGQTCWRAIVDMTLPGEAQVRAGEIWSNKGGIRASYSQLGNNQVYFWMTKATAPGQQSTPEEAYTLIRKELAHFDPIMQSVLQQLNPATLIHTDLYDLKPIAQWYRNHIVLLGDAAHATTPNLGQGASQAVEDAYVLAHYLANHPVAEAFRLYQEARYKRAKWVTDTSFMLGRITSIKNGFISQIRNFMVRNTPSTYANKQFNMLYGVELPG